MNDDERRHLEQLRFLCLIRGILGQFCPYLLYRFWQKEMYVWFSVVAFCWISSFLVTLESIFGQSAAEGNATPGPHVITHDRQDRLAVSRNRPRYRNSRVGNADLRTPPAFAPSCCHHGELAQLRDLATFLDLRTGTRQHQRCRSHRAVDRLRLWFDEACPSATRYLDRTALPLLSTKPPR